MSLTEKDNTISTNSSSFSFENLDADLNIIVLKRDGTEEDYEQDKVSNSIMQAALKVGGENYQLADDLAEQVTNILLENDIDKIESAELERLIKNLLIDEGHSSTATEYIIFSAERNKIREMNTTLIKTYEDITFKSGEESDSKRENANINSDTAMGTMLKYGSEGAKMFNLMYLMKPEHANAHKNGDIHIHDLDFFKLAWTCICDDTKLIVRYNNKVSCITAKELENIFNEIKTPDKLVENTIGLEVMCKGKFVKVYNLISHNTTNKKILNIKFPAGNLRVTDDHIVSILDSKNNIKDIEAKDLKIGDILVASPIDTKRFDARYIDLVELLGESYSDTVVITNSKDIIANVQELGNWKEFCNIFDYRISRNVSIRHGIHMTLEEFKKIEHLTELKHSDLKLKYKQSSSNIRLPGVLELTYELGRFIGLMYTEGSVTMYNNQGRDCSTITFSNYDEDLRNDFCACAAKVLPGVSLSEKTHKGKVVGIHLSGIIINVLFDVAFGYKNLANDIRLAQWMYTANEDFVSGLLGGIIDGNGVIDKSGYRVTFCSCSEDFLKDIQYLLLLRGIGSAITKVSGAEEGTLAVFDNAVTVRNFDNFRLTLSGNLKEKASWIKCFKIDNIKTKFKDSDKYTYKYTKIESIDTVDRYNGLVYDMQTESHHFDANGILVHNCDHIPLDRLFKDGFNTGHGYLREPGNIRTAGALAAIAIQSNQNDMYGGQAIPLFDYYLAPYVALTYVKRLALKVRERLDLEDEEYNILRNRLIAYQKENKLVMHKESLSNLASIVRDFLNANSVEYTDKAIKKIFENTHKEVYDETYQSMEAFIHNMNTLHSRAGSQVPFSSINFGTDTSVEGRMIIETFLLSAEKGLGYGEIAIFPISIFKLKAGVNYNEGDPNYDLFKLACRVSAKTLYPNFLNLDATYNAELYVEGRPETEMATMGCVEASETIKYKIGDSIFIETFSDAYSRIERLVNNRVTSFSNNSEYIDLEQLCTDVSVWDSSENKFVKVRKFIRNSNVNNWKVVKLSDGYSLTATDDHPLPILNKGRTLVSDIQTGDKIKTGRIAECNYTNKLNTVYFKDKAWLLGLILADSSYSSQINISLGLDEYDIVEELEKEVESLGYTFRLTEQHRGVKGNYVDIAITGISQNKEARAELAELFGGYKKEDRRITSELLTMDRKHRVQFLAGLIDADGHITTSRDRSGNERSARFSLGSTNKALAMTELCLIRELGYNVKMYRNKYSSRHNKIRYLLEFEITKELLDELKCNKKINKAYSVEWCKYTEVDTVEVVSVTDGCEENENPYYSYDLETESDRLDISFIQSHNCRTRVGKNVYDPDKSVIPGRGNLSFTSINLPRLAIKSKGDIELFYRLLDKTLELVHDQLLERFEIQCMRHMINHPFLLGQGNWLGSDRLGPTDDIRAILKHGTMAVGFIGLAETLVALTGKHHGESEEAQKLGLEIIGHMREMTDAWAEDEKMNYGLIGTPAEGLSGRFVRIDKEKYGVIKGVTDKEYYTNSSHVPVWYNISAFKKIQIEAPYHQLQNGGHILYIELDGDTSKNIKAFMKIIKCMYDNNAGYFSINHPVDRDPVCGYVGVIGDTCPRCGRKEGEAMTMETWMKLKGYAGAGNADTLGYAGNPDEEMDRIPNKLSDASKIKFERKS